MTDRTATLLIMVAGVAVMANTMGPKAAPYLIWNASESVPTGLYHVQPAHQLSVTTLVAAYPPEPLATYLADGGYLPRGVPLIKRILALPGQTVCRTGLTITVNGIDVGAARERPPWSPAPGLAGVRCDRRLEGLPHESGRAGIA